jgi:hypothetical protein
MVEIGSLNKTVSASSITLQHHPLYVVYTSASSHVASLLLGTDHCMDGFNLLSHAVFQNYQSESDFSL